LSNKIESFILDGPVSTRNTMKTILTKDRKTERQKEIKTERQNKQRVCKTKRKYFILDPRSTTFQIEFKSNLSTTATLGTPKKWPLFKG
jgi:hypothetical protein